MGKVIKRILIFDVKEWEDVTRFRGGYPRESVSQLRVIRDAPSSHVFPKRSENTIPKSHSDA